MADANVLYSRTLRDYFLYAAAESAIEIHWSQQILDEMSRNLRDKLGLSEADTARLELLMNDYLEYALIDVGPADLAAVDRVDMDPSDRHVLAAALSAGADILLTENTRHFPGEWMAAHDLELSTAGDLLARLTSEFPDKMRVAHELTVRHSPKSSTEVLATLETIVGTYTADAVRRLVTHTDEHQENQSDG
ncbi:MAG: PIN domain-containing protein [Dermatophilaceae bacterium]